MDGARRVAGSQLDPRDALCCGQLLSGLAAVVADVGCTGSAERTAPCLPCPQEVAARLSALAVKRGSQDNVAVVLIDLGKVDWSKQSAGGGGLFGSLGSLFGSRG